MIFNNEILNFCTSLLLLFLTSTSMFNASPGTKPEYGIPTTNFNGFDLHFNDQNILYASISNGIFRVDGSEFIFSCFITVNGNLSCFLNPSGTSMLTSNEYRINPCFVSILDGRCEAKGQAKLYLCLPAGSSIFVPFGLPNK